jgi:hypothetical protein
MKWYENQTVGYKGDFPLKERERESMNAADALSSAEHKEGSKR